LALGVVPVVDAGAATLTVTGIAASKLTLPPDGGSVTISATPSGDAQCSVVVSPTGATVPPPVACKKGVKVSFKIFVPPNTTARKDPYKSFVRACSNGTCVQSATVTVNQWAYAISTTAATAPWGAPTSISCPAVSFCGITDGSSYVTTGRAGKYRRVLLQQGRIVEDALCTSPTSCSAADLSGDIFTFNGTSWKKAKTITGLSSPATLIGRLTPSRKAMYTWIEASFDGRPPANVYVTGTATTWSTPKSFSSAGKVTSIACPPTLATCIAVDDLGNWIVFGGSAAPVTLHGAPTGDGFTTIACGSASMCMGGGGGGGAGGFLARRMPGRATFASITLEAAISHDACLTTTMCVVESPTSTGQLLSVAVGDLNKDGIPDIVICSAKSVPAASSAVLTSTTGTTPTFMAAAKQKEFTGHVTLIK
jgi:hypothetical protein